MKNLIYAFTICLFVTACEKYESGPITSPSTRQLSESEITLKTNLDQAAKIVAEIIQYDAVINEINLLSDESRTFYSLPFRDLMDESKGPGASFKNLRERFLEGCSSGETKGGWRDLASYLAGNDCYIYCPYPSNFYPKGTNSFTVAGHPVDNDAENKGYRFEGKKVLEVTVNEEYADKYPVILIMPKDEDNDDLKGLVVQKDQSVKGDPIYEVKLGKVRCADYCGGLFEGDLELRVSRGYPEVNITSGAVTGKFSSVIPISYPRSYAKAAIRDFTVHSSGGWFTVNMPWDTNWKTEKVLQCIMAYEYDTVKESSLNATVGYKSDNVTPTVTATMKATYSGDFLGLIEWDRDWFYRTNTTPGPGDEVKDGLTVRKTCPDFKLTTPARTIY